MQLNVYFDLNKVHDPSLRGDGLPIEASSFNFVADVGYLTLRNRHGAQAQFWRVAGIIATEPAAEAEHWKARFS